MPSPSDVIKIVQFVRGVQAAGKAVGRLTSSVAKSGIKLVEYGRAYASFGDRIASLSNKWMDLQDVAFKTARTMGLSRDEAMKMDRQLMEEIKNLGRAYGTSAQDIAEYQKEYAANTGRNIQLTKAQMEQMVALGNITDNATASKLVEEFDTIGVSVEDTLAYTGQLQERAKYLGLNATKASKTFAENINLAASYSFKNGVDDIEQMVLKSQSLKMNMQAVMTAADKFSNISDAIKTSANIQMLGGSFAQQFSNPMGAMYESMADPKAFQDRLIRTIEGKGNYNSKTNEVTFDPVTMLQMKEMAKQLGITVEELTKPAMAMSQNKAVDKEIAGKGWSEDQKKAIEDLSRTNFDEKTGKHFVKILDKYGNETKTNVEDLTEEQLKQAQDSQLTQDKMWADVHAIKEKIVGSSMGRARETRSEKENLQGFGESVRGGIAQIENILMPTISGILNGGNGLFGKIAGAFTRIPGMNPFYSRPIFGGDAGVNHYADGGLVKPKHAEDGTVVGGDSYMGDQVPVMANSGEMILNQPQQNGLFSLLSSIGKIGLGALIGNKIGNKLGVGNIGTKSVISSALFGGDMFSTMFNMGMARKFGNFAPMNPIQSMLGMPSMSMPMQPQSGMQAASITIPNGVVNIGNANIQGLNENASENNDDNDNDLGDVVDQLSDLKENAKGFKETFREFGNKWGLKGKLGNTKLGKGLIYTGKKAKQFGKFVANSKLTQGIKFVGDKAKSSAIFAGSKIRSAGERFGKTKFATNAKDFFGDLKNVGKSAVDTGEKAAFGSHLGKATAALGKMTSGAFKIMGKGIPILGSALTAMDAIGDIAGDVSDKNLSSVGKGKAIGGSVGSVAGTALMSMIPGVGAILGPTLGPVIGKAVGSFIGKSVPNIGKSIGKAFKGIGNIGKSLIGGIGTVGKSLFGGIFGSLNDSENNNGDVTSSEASNGNVAKPANTGNGFGSKVWNATKAFAGFIPLVMAGKAISSIGKKIFGGNKSGKGNELTEKDYLKNIYALLQSKLGVSKADAKRNNIGKKIITDPVKSAMMKSPRKIGVNPISPKVKSLPIVGSKQYIRESNNSVNNTNNTFSFGGESINLNVSGTIKLDLGGKQANVDAQKLLDSPVFRSQLTQIISRRLNDMGNAGKYNKEGSPTNSKGIYNRIR